MACPHPPQAFLRHGHCGLVCPIPPQPSNSCIAWPSHPPLLPHPQLPLSSWRHADPQLRFHLPCVPRRPDGPRHPPMRPLPVQGLCCSRRRWLHGNTMPCLWRDLLYTPNGVAAGISPAAWRMKARSVGGGGGVQHFPLVLNAKQPLRCIVQPGASLRAYRCRALLSYR